MGLTMATERGKIGRLPEALRAELNAMIRDNRTAVDIQAFLEAKGITGVTPQNISNWKKYGFEKWAARQARIDEMKSRMEFAADLSRECQATDGADLAGDVAGRLAMDSCTAILEGFDPANFQAMLAEKPEKFVDLVHVVSVMRNTEVKLAEFKRKIRAAIDQAAHVADEKGGATADDIKQIFNQAYGV